MLVELLLVDSLYLFCVLIITVNCFQFSLFNYKELFRFSLSMPFIEQQQRVILVTGGNRGIDFQVLKKLVEQHYDLIG